MRWQMWREAELLLVEGYVFHESSIRPRIRTLNGREYNYVSYQFQDGLNSVSTLMANSSRMYLYSMSGL